MNIFGHEYGFMFTVQASIELAEICPGKRLENMNQLFEADNPTESMRTAAKMAEILSRGHEQNKKFVDQGYTPNVLTAEMALALTHGEFAKLQKEISKSINSGKETEIELETSKKNNDQAAAVTG